MKPPSHADAFEVLVLQAADEGRGPILFGESLMRARKLARPFVIGTAFPDIYLEFPLAGNPFLDVTVLYNELPDNPHIESPAAAGTDALLNLFAKLRKEYTDVSCGFELDTKKADLPSAAVHLQPRSHIEVVAPLCEALGEPERAQLYLELAQRMPENWPLSFFGMFRGRKGSPLRVCGYLSQGETSACAQDPKRLADVFDEIGFTAYDDAMLAQASQLLAAVPAAADFQFDIYPDGHLSGTFAIDAQFSIEQPDAVRRNFEDGPAARIMNLLESWGIADERRKLGAESAFARAIPVELDDGQTGRYAFTLMPQWAKVRWIDGVLQPAKLYLLAHAGLISE